ncbi:MAG: MFS transporter [Kiritimatiellae bacterium]|nr:MFS transporter [Kiritimatiellia bacterium]
MKGREATSPNPVWLVAACCAVYFASYLTRKGYDASILAICESTGLARKAAGLASTAAVALYGSGQFATGFLADRFDPRKMIAVALMITAACNAVMPFAAGAACIPAMVGLWAVNGFAQAMFWPPLVKIVAANLPAKAYKSAVFYVSVSANVAIVAVFFLVSGCIRFAGWRSSFAVVSCLAVAMAAAWCASIRRLAPSTGTAEASLPGGTAGRGAGASGEAVPLGKLVAAAGLAPVMAAIACQGILRDGIEVWAPSIVRDQYGLDASGSVFSVSLLPVFGVLSMGAARALRRALGDEIEAAGALFAIGSACAAVLFATGGGTLAFGLPVLAVLSACMHGANLMLIGELPGRFARYGRVGAVSGVLNAFTYVGAAVSIYGFAALHERFDGWRPVFAVWIAVLAAGIAMLACAWRRWRRFAK